MSMKKNYKTGLVIAVILLAGIVLHFPAKRMVRTHVNEKTAVEDHPLNCISCHLYTRKSGIMAKLINADYLSPFNLVVSKDGKKLYVVAEEGNALLIVDAEKGKVLSEIAVGQHPHSVVLDEEEKKAYVSNQWSDNVMVIDLFRRVVTDTLNAGSGPAGITLSQDGHFLYVVNSYTSNISIIDVTSGEEKEKTGSR